MDGYLPNLVHGERLTAVQHLGHPALGLADRLSKLALRPTARPPYLFEDGW